jgi:serine/threonine protein kinase
MSTHVSNQESLAATLDHLQLVCPEALEEVRASAELSEDEVLAALVEAGHLTRFQAQAIGRGAAPQLAISHYVLLEPIGTGAMGTVYKARSRNDDGMYAIRVVPRRNVINLKTLSAKVEAMKQVRHPRVSAMMHVGTQRDWAFVVYPYLEGGDKLDAIVKKHGRLAPRQAAQVAQQIASGLQAYHAHGLFHGLLKPNDVVIGSDRRVRLLDFGVGFLLACERGKSLLSTTTNGKAMARGLDCASPESIMDPLDRSPAGDQYSLGCILYYCLSGQFPFPDANPVKKMLGHQFEEPTPISELAPEVPEALDEIVMRMLAKRPEDRYAGIDEVAEELQALIADRRALPSTLPRAEPADSVNLSAEHKPVAAPVPQAAEAPEAPLPAWVSTAVAVGAGVAAALGMWVWLVNRG